MRFIVQSDNELDIEKAILLEKLNTHKYTDEYYEVKLDELKDIKYSGEEIPVGTIDFVTTCLHNMVNFEKQNPIEIPIYLRTPEFLKREYNIVTWDKIPRCGRYFIKDASTLKHFSYCGSLEYFIQEDMFEKPKWEFDTSLRLSKDALYVVSEEVSIKSEYRVYVFNRKLVSIANYGGYPTVFPDIDIINKAIDLINTNEKWLKSYTIDIMVNNRGTSIIEVHNFTSCGLYTTLFGDDLLLGYRQGIDYLKNDNKELEQ